MNIAIFAGELSGDLIGAGLAKEIRRMAPEARLWGLGSTAMREAGVEILADSASWGAIGVTQALSKIPGLMFRVAPLVRQELKKRRPNVVIPIDFGAFNVRAARWSKEQGLKVLYYFPPGAWRREGTKGADLTGITDMLATPFEWSAERYRKLGAKAVCVGHPLLERVRPVMTRAEFAAQFDMDPARPIIGLLPGSRHHEVEHLMPALLSAARIICRSVPDAQFVVGVAGSISQEAIARYLSGHKELRDRLSEIWHDFASEAEASFRKQVTQTAGALTPQKRPLLVTSAGVVVSAEDFEEEADARQRKQHLQARSATAPPPTVLAKGLTYDVMAHSDLLLTCSGTATLEASIFQTPMIVLYRGSKIMEVEYHLLGLKKKLQFMSLPNILAQRAILPELIQHAASPENIARIALPLLNDIETRQKMKSDLREVAEMLGTPGASERAARLALELAAT